MQSDDELEPGQSELAEALESLAPAGARLDPLAAAIEAGRRSVTTQLRLWQGTSVAVTLLCVVLLSVLQIRVQQSSPRSATIAPQLAMRHTNQPVESLSDLTELRLEQAALRGGLDALPPVDRARAPDIKASDIF
jgi:hypothetical protein